MKKYFIVLIVGLCVGVLFARSAYGQENYFTPALQANKENSESKALSAATYEVNNFYYKQYTYPYYIESGDFFETKYVLYLRSTKYEDVEVNLTYIQPYFIYSETISTAQSIDVLLSCIQDNIKEVQSTIIYCNSCEYEKSLVESLENLIGYLVKTHDYIKDCAYKYLDYYYKEDFASCVKELLNIQINYWQLYTSLAGQNPDGTSTISFTYTENEE